MTSLLRRLVSVVVFLGVLQAAPLSAADLDAAEVAQVELPRVYRLDGVAEAVNRSTVSAQTAGRVTEVKFDVDDYVRAGDVIIRLEDTQQQASVDQARANLDAAIAKRQDAEKEFNRIKGVFAKGAVAKAELDKVTAVRKQARAGEQAARAALEKSEQEREYTRIRAPYNGIVTERLIEVGETAQPGRAVMSGISLDDMRVSVDVPQNLIDSIRREGEAQVEIDDKWIVAEDITVFPVADPRSDTFKVRLRLPAGIQGVFPGMYLKVGFVAGSDRRLVIPLSAVVLRSEVVGAYVVDDDGNVRFRHIRLGSPAGPGQVSVLSGLTAGERVATDPVAATIRLKAQRRARSNHE